MASLFILPLFTLVWFLFIHSFTHSFNKHSFPFTTVTIYTVCHVPGPLLGTISRRVRTGSYLQGALSS